MEKQKKKYCIHEMKSMRQKKNQEIKEIRKQIHKHEHIYSLFFFLHYY